MFCEMFEEVMSTLSSERKLQLSTAVQSINAFLSFLSQSSPQEYFGDLVVKVGYRTEAEGIVSIYGNGKKPVPVIIIKTTISVD